MKTFDTMDISNEKPILIKPTKIYAFLMVIPQIIGLILFIILSNHFIKLLHDSSLRYYKIAYETLYTAVAYFGLSIIYNFFITRSFEYFVTDQQIKIKSGIFNKRIDYLELYRVKDYIVLQPFLLSIFKLMDFKILSVDINSRNASIVMKGIPVTEFPTVLRELVQNARNNNRIFNVESQPI